MDAVTGRTIRGSRKRIYGGRRTREFAMMVLQQRRITYSNNSHALVMDVATGEVAQVTLVPSRPGSTTILSSRMRNESGLTTGCALDATLEPAPVPERHARRLAIIRLPRR